MANKPYTRIPDPTQNVIMFVKAEVRRLDDLMTAHGKADAAEHAHLKEVAELRAIHSKELRESESDRLDKIRQGDVLAVSTAADKAAAAIQSLAVTTAANADNLRSSVENTAQMIARQTSETVGAITERLAALEKSNYEGVGRQRVSDPQIADLLSEVKGLRDSRSLGAGKNAGISAVYGWITAAIVAGVAIADFVMRHTA